MQPFTQGLSFLATAPATGTEPAGGAAIGQVILATSIAAAGFAALAWLCMGHRSGRLSALGRAADFTERIAGIPGWAALPSFVSAISLIVALLGMYWDISLHIDVGRDPGPLANPAHYLILVGLFGILSAGTLAVFLPMQKPGPYAVRIVGGWYAPVGGLLITACGAFALIGFPLDDIWHRIFGQDVTLWGPTHLMLIGGAGMTLIGQAILLVEGMRARADSDGSESPKLAVRLRRTGLMGGLLIGLSTFQGEFDFGVPQFRFVLEPVMLALAASLALVCARLWIGRGGALLAAGMFVMTRGLIGLIVWGVFGETFPHLPIYLAEAVLVELTAFALTRRGRELPSPLALGAVSGVLIGTVGFAAEYGWSQFAMPLPWTTDLLPEGVAMATAAGIAGGLLGALLGSALRGELPQGAVARRAIPLGALAMIMAVFGAGLVTSVPDGVRAHVKLATTSPAPKREVKATVKIDPAEAAANPAWLTATAWQGGGLAVNRLDQVGPGTYRTTEPIPVNGDWKALIRLQRGDEVIGVPIYLPRDVAIPAPKVPAPDRFTRAFTADHSILQREQNQDVPGWLDLAAHLVVLAIALSLLAGLGWGVGRIGNADGRAPRSRRRALPSLRPAGAR
jgi:hypothetical protein